MSAADRTRMGQLSQSASASAAAQDPSHIQTQTQTQTQTQAQTQEAPAILRLRGAHDRNLRSVQWAEDVVDNEGLNRKKSKVCCIYHRPRGADESSDSESSSSDSDSDSDASGDDPADADQRPRRPAGHRHTPDCEHGEPSRGPSGPSGPSGSHIGAQQDRSSHTHDSSRSHARRTRRPSPNAYEKMPRYDRPSRPAGSGGNGAA